MILFIPAAKLCVYSGVTSSRKGPIPAVPGRYCLPGRHDDLMGSGINNTLWPIYEEIEKDKCSAAIKADRNAGKIFDHNEKILQLRIIDTITAIGYNDTALVTSMQDYTLWNML